MATDKMQDAVKRETQISNQLQDQERNLARLEEVVSTLLGNLEQITTPTDLEVAGNKEPDVLVPMAETLRKNNFRLSSIIDTINDLSDRVEL